MSETNRAIEVGFQVASCVLAASLLVAVCLAILGMSVHRLRVLWRRSPMAIVVPSAIALALSLGIIVYFALMLYVIDRSRSPVDYFPGYEGAGLFLYGSLACLGLVVSLAVMLWVVSLRGGPPSPQ